MQKPAGYLIKRQDGLYGERGMFYDYILAENGVFIEAEGPLLAARVPVVEANIRGLAPVEPKFVLRHGPIPQRHFDLALSAMLADKSKEKYVAITWNDGYHIFVPEQDQHEAHLQYEVADSVILDLHSHGTMAAFFSGARCRGNCAECSVEFCDQRDEQGLKIYGVVGHLGGNPQVRLRVGCYGYFYTVSWGEVFEGSLYDVVDLATVPEAISEEEEVIIADELHCGAEGQHESPENRGGWLRRHWWFRR